MKTKIVLWGANEADEKILIGVELVDKENKVLIHKIPEAAATEEVYKMMMENWRDGKDMTWPAERVEIIRELSMAEGLLPDDIKVERTDVISRAKAEWHFVVLSSKLYEMYHGEVDDFKDKVDTLTNFDGTLWEDLKTFWSKVQNQVQDKNLFREHAGKLRAKTNELFDSMKTLKKTADTEFKKQSKVVIKEFKEKLATIDEKIEKGLGLKPIFEELKKLQAKVKDADFTRDDRNDIWKKIDKSFKAVKEKRFGDKANTNNNAAGRLDGRYNGLISAINRMQGSIKKDVQDKNFQSKRINDTDGQLEAQIRQAKLVMIDERINSKQIKLDDMLKTKTELESRIAREKAKEEARAEKAKAKEVANELKAKIQQEIAEKQKNRTPEQEAELKKAADVIAATKKKRVEKSPVAAAAAVATKSTGEKVEELLTAEAPIADAKVDAKTKVEAPKKEEAKEEESILGAISASMGEAIGSVTDTVKAISTVVADKVEDTVDEVKASLSDNDDGGEGSGSIFDAMKDAVSDTIDKVKDAGESVVDAVESKMDEENVGDKAKSLMDKITATVEDAVDKVKDVSAKVADEIEDKVEDVKESLADSKEKSGAKSAAKTVAVAGGLMGAFSGLIGDVVDAAKDLGDVVADKLDDITGEEE